MKKILPLLLICIFYINLVLPVQATKSEYVLPYPSFMPGSKFYLISTFFDKIKRYWYFGNLGRFKYDLYMSDKKLVEAKTLFEYKQYKLALKALEESNTYFIEEMVSIHYIKKNHIKNENFIHTYQSQAQRHIQVITDLKDILPKTYIWKEEYKDPQELPIDFSLLKATIIRNYAIE